MVARQRGSACWFLDQSNDEYSSFKDRSNQLLDVSTKYSYSFRGSGGEGSAGLVPVGGLAREERWEAGGKDIGMGDDVAGAKWSAARKGAEVREGDAVEDRRTCELAESG